MLDGKVAAGHAPTRPAFFPTDLTENVYIPRSLGARSAVVPLYRRNYKVRVTGIVRSTTTSTELTYDNRNYCMHA